MSSKLTFLALAIMILIVPTMASPYPSAVDYADATKTTLTDVTNAHYNVTPGEAIGTVRLELERNTNATFTIGYGNGNTISGEVNYVYVGEGLFGALTYGRYSYSRVAIGSDEANNTFLDVGADVVKRYEIIGHGTDKAAGTVGFAVWDTSIIRLLTPENIAYEPISDLKNKPTYWIDIQSNKPIDVVIVHGDQKYIQSTAFQTPTDVLFGGLEEATQQTEFVSGIVTSVFVWAIFLWENIGMIVALYIALTGFMAFKAGKNNILRSIQIFFGYQKKLFETILALPYFIIDLADKIKSLIVRWI